MLLTLEKLQKDIIDTIRSITESPEKQWDQIVLNEERESKEEVVTFDVAMSYLPMNEYGQAIYADTIKFSGRKNEQKAESITQLPLVRKSLQAKTVHELMSNIKSLVEDPSDYLESLRPVNEKGEKEDLSQVEIMQRSFSALMAYKVIYETLVQFDTRSSGKNFEFISAGLMGGAVPSDTVIEDFVVDEGVVDPEEESGEKKKVYYSLKLLKEGSQVQGSLPLLYQSVVDDGKQFIFLVVEKKFDGKQINFETLSPEQLKGGEIELTYNFYKVKGDKIKRYILSNDSLKKISETEEGKEVVPQLRHGFNGDAFPRRKQEIASNVINLFKELNEFALKYREFADLIERKQVKMAKGRTLIPTITIVIALMNKLMKTNLGKSEEFKEYSRNINFIVDKELGPNLFFFLNRATLDQVRTVLNSDEFPLEGGTEEKVTYIYKFHDGNKNFRTLFSLPDKNLFPKKGDKNYGKKLAEANGKLELLGKVFPDVLTEQNINFYKELQSKIQTYRESRYTTGQVENVEKAIYKLTEEYYDEGRYNSEKLEDINNYFKLFSKGSFKKGGKQIKVEFKSQRSTFLNDFCSEDFDRLPITISLSSEQFVNAFEEFGGQLNDSNQIIVESIKKVCQYLTSFNRGLKGSLAEGMTTESLRDPYTSLSSLVGSWNTMAEEKKKQG